MMDSIRIWLAPMLTFALLLTYDAVHRQVDYAAAAEAENARSESSVVAESQGWLPVLSILEAGDMLGSAVTVEGKVLADSQKKADGKVLVQLEDQTGSVPVCFEAGSFRKGDVLRVTGKMGDGCGMTGLSAKVADVQRIR
ncbi:OB-fold nucleic acid binding domain-containing protein [Paenibacillus hodogayensis]|uniref:OB-fold nucleic acid binding domain-containing protein n=1 Tax=Paenibacillus hodogayensis TaxID=279208 RepID=A0ABV5W117_9BACL